MELNWVEAIGFGGTFCTILTYSMRTIIPLRIAGIVGSFFFIGYGFLIGSWPMLVTEFVILPLNSFRLYQLLRLNRQAERAAKGDLSLDWLRPFSTSVPVTAGHQVFARNDTAAHLYIIEEGSFVLPEAGITLGKGEIVGEMGFLTSDNRRTMSLVCAEGGKLGRISYSDLRQLYLQNPAFGFYFLRLISERLFHNLEEAKRNPASA